MAKELKTYSRLSDKEIWGVARFPDLRTVFQIHPNPPAKS